MKRTSSLFVMTAVIAVSSVFFMNLTAEEDTPLVKAMEKVSSPYKKLRRSHKDPAKKEITLGYLRTMLEYSAKSKTYKPAYLAKIPDGKKAEFMAGYHKKMNDLIRAILEMEEAVIKGDTAAASAAYTKIKDAKGDGHEKFIEE